MRITNLIVAAAVLSIAGCSHPMVISPSLANIKANPDTQKIRKNVGYYIAPELRAMEANTAASSGDRVIYKPYQDIETGLYMVLGQVFTDVTRLSSLTDKSAIAKAKIDYIIVPEIVTESSATNAMVWMPGRFKVDLTLTIRDTAGKPVASVNAKGEGKATISETTTNLSAAGVRASEDALNRMQQALLNTPQLRADRE